MQTGVISVPPDMSLAELARLLVREGISGAPVVDPEGRPVGVVSLRDLATRAARLEERTSGYYLDVDRVDLVGGAFHFQPDSLSLQGVVSDIMTPRVYSADAEASVREVIALMKRRSIHRVLVTRQGEMVGIISTVDLMDLLDRLLQEPA